MQREHRRNTQRHAAARHHELDRRVLLAQPGHRIPQGHAAEGPQRRHARHGAVRLPEHPRPQRGRPRDPHRCDRRGSGTVGQVDLRALCQRRMDARDASGRAGTAWRTLVARPNKPAKPLSKSHKSTILKNRYYVGVVTFEGAEYPGKHEPSFRRVSTSASRPSATHGIKAGEKPRQRPHFLKGSLYCGQCGEPLSLEITRNRARQLLRILLLPWPPRPQEWLHLPCGPSCPGRATGRGSLVDGRAL